MSFQPVIPLTGYAGWRFLERTLDSQQAAFSQSQPISRATDYFREQIASVRTADDLVRDRRLLSVALGAFGLDEDIDNRFFIRKVLEDGTIADEALANRLADPRYAEFSRVFAFGDRPSPRTGLIGFADDIIARFEAKQFERAVGEQNNDLRLAMNVATALSDILDRTASPNAQWFSVLGDPPLRNVVQTALGLPASVASIDLDKQLDLFKERSQAVLGTGKVSGLADPAVQDKLIRLFLVRSESAAVAQATGGSIALTLLQSAPTLSA